MSDDIETLRAGCEEFVRMQRELCELLDEDSEGDSLALHDRCVYGIKALKEHMVLEGWQPIETCPAAPTKVLLWFPALGYPVTGTPEAYGYREGGWKATHWMPLPAPPQDAPRD